MLRSDLNPGSYVSPLGHQKLIPNFQLRWQTRVQRVVEEKSANPHQDRFILLSLFIIHFYENKE